MGTRNDYLVSILVPVYGVEKYIARCARSLFEQSYRNIEYIFVDDCTSDKSIDVLFSVLEEFPDRKEQVNVIKNISNRGLAAVRNIAIEHCRGIFVMHVDSDDWIDKNVVQSCVNSQINDDSDIVLFDKKIYMRQGVKTLVIPPASNGMDLTLQMLRRERDISIWGMLIRRDLYTNNKVSNVEGVNMSEDYQVTPRLAYYSKNVTIVHGIFYNYEMRNAKSITAGFSMKNVRQEWITHDILKDFFADKGDIFVSALNYGICKQNCYYRHNAALLNQADALGEINDRLSDYSLIFSCMPIHYKIGLKIKSLPILNFYVTFLFLLKGLRFKRTKI